MTLADDGRLQIELADGNALLLDTHRVCGLEGLTRSDLSTATLSASGLELHIAAADADLYLPEILAGRFGAPGHTCAARRRRPV